MKKLSLKPLGIFIGMALAGSASALTMDFSGTNFYMKFLDGNQYAANTGSIDTNSGSDQGQFSEMNLIFKATISPQVEAGGRIQSRSSAAYWTDFGGWGSGATTNAYNDTKFMKLRGAYAELTPGYSWLSNIHIGTSDWGMFDPFTVGKVRYIDRDNYNGFYFKGPISSGSTWELARISLPNYLQFNWGQGPCIPGCGTDNSQYNEAVYIAQVKVPIQRVKLAGSYQVFNDHALSGTGSYTGQNTADFYRDTVGALKAEGSPSDALDMRGALYWSKSAPIEGVYGQGWGNSPAGKAIAKAFKLDMDWTTPADGLTFNFQYFNIGAGYYSNVAARRESDVLLTEGTESAWYNWGNPLWSGGAAATYTQSASNGPVTDNGFMDFDESPAQSAVGWKGLTAVGKLDVANSPMSLELTGIGYNNNWQGYSASGPLANLYAANQDRQTRIAVFKFNHNFPVMGGLDTNLKIKSVWDKDYKIKTDPTDDRGVYDKGVTLSAGNQLAGQLYGTLSYGRYFHNIKAGGIPFNNAKNIYSLKLAYNLPGFEFGMLTQWIKGRGNPTETVGLDQNIQQYRMKAYAQVNF